MHRNHLLTFTLCCSHSPFGCGGPAQTCGTKAEIELTLNDKLKVKEIRLTETEERNF